MDFIKNLAGRMTMERDRHQEKRRNAAHNFSCRKFRLSLSLTMIEILLCPGLFEHVGQSVRLFQVAIAE